MAIEKDIAIHHTKGIDNVITYTKDPQKSNIILNRKEEENRMDIDTLIMQGEEQDIINALSYAEDLEKTVFQLDGDEQLLTSGILCKKDHAASQFQMVRAAYYKATSKCGNRIKGTKKDKNTGQTVKKESIEAYHVIQSFPEVEGLDPRLVHKIGIEYAKAAFPGHQCVVSTHMNTAHLHNHIIVNAYSAENIGRKYKMDMARRHEIRRINDEISLKYGLPILMNNDLRRNRGVTWHEWKARTDGNSWKEKLRDDILEARKAADSWEEYKELMEGAGYKIRETKSTITYTMPDSETRKCRDKRLGTDFTKEALCSYWIKKAQEAEKERTERKIEYEIYTPPADNGHIHVSRYTMGGRRRTELEMIILTAIRIIQYFKDRFLNLLKEDNTNDPVNKPHKEKLDIMFDALEMMKKSKISTKAELEAAMKKTGSELSHIKKVLRDREPIADYEDEIAEKLKEILKLEAALKEMNITPDRLFLHSYTEEEIARNIAELQPMTPAIRRELYQKVNEKKLFLKNKFSNISYSEAMAVIDYADGKTDKLPACLMTAADAKEKAIQRQFETDDLSDKVNSSDSSAQTHNRECDNKFDLLTRYLNEEDKELLFSYRALLNKIISLGINPEQLSTVLEQYEANKLETGILQKQLISLKDEYKELSKIKWYIDLAENNSFLRGPLFGRSDRYEIDKTSPDISEKQQKTITPYMDEDISRR